MSHQTSRELTPMTHQTCRDAVLNEGRLCWSEDQLHDSIARSQAWFCYTIQPRSEVDRSPQGWLPRPLPYPRQTEDITPISRVQFHSPTTTPAVGAKERKKLTSQDQGLRKQQKRSRRSSMSAPKNDDQRLSTSGFPTALYSLPPSTTRMENETAEPAIGKSAGYDQFDPRRRHHLADIRPTNWKGPEHGQALREI